MEEIDKWTMDHWNEWNLARYGGHDERHVIIVTTLLKLGIDWSEGVHLRLYKEKNDTHINWSYS